jgi:magnesium-transporting ATPase (P-type)
MELDDIKGAWAQYDKKLNEQLKLNEALLRKINLNSSKRELQKPLLYEISGVIILLLLVVSVTSFSIGLLEEARYSVPGFLAALMGVVFFVFGVVKVNHFSNINYYGTSVLELQKEIARLNKLVLRLRKYELILIPVFVLPLLPLLFKVIHNIDLYQNVKLLIVEVVVILGLGYSLTFWINKKFYDKKFRNAEKLLAELEHFEREE